MVHTAVDDVMSPPGISAEAAIRALAVGAVLGVPEGDVGPVSRGREWPASRTLGADLLGSLLLGTGQGAHRKPHPGGLRLRGVRIRGRLDLGKGSILLPLTAEHCYFDEPIILDEATGSSLVINDSWLAGVRADSLALTRGFDFQRNVVTGEVCLTGASVAGQWDCAGTRIIAKPGGPALTAFLVTVQRGVFLSDGFQCHGPATFQNATVGEFFVINRATFRNQEYIALDLEGVRVDGRLSANDMVVLSGMLDLTRARVRSVDLQGLRLASSSGYPAVLADGLSCDGDVTFGSSTAISGMTILDSATVGGLVLGGRLDVGAEAEGSVALSGRGLQVERSFTIDGELDVRGRVELAGARFGGDVDLSRARITTRGSAYFGLVLDRASVAGTLGLGGTFSASGGVSLTGASVGRDITFGGSWTASGKLGLDGSRIKVDGDVVLEDTFSVDGRVSFSDSYIEGDLRLGGELGVPGATGFDARRCHVLGAVIWSAPEGGGSRMRGTVAMEGIRCEGALMLSGMSCGHADDAGSVGPRSGAGAPADPQFALALDYAQLGSGLYLNEGFRAEGGVSLFRVKVTGVVNARDSAFLASDIALNAEGMQAGIILIDGCECSGEVVLADVECQGINASRAVFRGRLKLRRLRVAGPAYLCPASLQGDVDISFASVRVLKVSDSFLQSSPDLNGFTYDAIEGSKPGRFVDMLPAGARFTAQPYEQLAQVLRSAGETDVARDVLIHMRRRQFDTGSNRLIKNVRSALVGAAATFIYRPGRSFWWLMALGLIGVGLFQFAAPEHFTPAREGVPAFNAFVYSFDTLLPIIDFKQHDAWVAHSYARVWSWIAIAAGWVLSTTLVAGITRAVSRA